MPVQKTENHARPLYQFAPRLIFCVAASFLNFAAASVCAGEPVMTLAMNEPPGNKSTAPSPDLTPGTDRSPLNLKTSQPEAASPNGDKPVALLSDSQIESQSISVLPESFTLDHENSHPNKPVTVQAGCGRIWDDQSTLKKIACDHQEPGCAYVSANFSF